MLIMLFKLHKLNYILLLDICVILYVERKPSYDNSFYPSIVICFSIILSTYIYMFIFSV